MDANLEAAVPSEDLQTAPADAHLTKLDVHIKLKTSRGSKLEYKFPSGKAEPNKVLLAALAELARIAAVAGLEREARDAVEAKFKDVAEWRAAKGAA